MNRHPRILRSLFLAFPLFLLVGAVADCGPVAGPWSGGGPGLQYVCDAPRTVGQACGTSDGCASGLYCTESNSGTVGTCEPRIALGGACEAAEDCVAGLACKQVPQDGTCYLLNCDANDVCQQGNPSGAICNPPATDCPAKQLCAMSSVVIGKCSALPKSGDSCDGYLGLDACGPDLTCQRLTIKCVPFPKAGELCGFSTKECADGLVCRIDADPAIDGRCGKPVSLGGKCGGGDCVKGAYCDLAKLVCKKNLGVGQSCQNGNECGWQPFDVHSGVECVHGKCIDTSKAGAECWPGLDNQCSLPMSCVSAP
ncbi:MAG: hypothetical protein EXR75_01980 [Myxococcales bacterium]|nr:hypothetical protein [Myxococcales bacterium]